MKSEILTQSSLEALLHILSEREPALARVIDEYGIPPLWKREEGFATLTHIILEQQVSLQSAKAVFERLCAVCEPSASAIANFGEDGLRSIGITRQKARYIAEAAQAVVSGQFSMEALQEMSDEAARTELMRLKGVGAWTANVYLLMALCRADAFPAGDLALQIAAHGVMERSHRPTADELTALAESWKPYRAVAARILWHWYLGTREHRTKLTKRSDYSAP
jgi:DNA-3-methyladenine glycosylase II